jgi:hypothetical protein
MFLVKNRKNSFKNGPIKLCSQYVNLHMVISRHKVLKNFNFCHSSTKVCSHKLLIHLKLKFFKTLCLLITIWRFTYCEHNFIGPWFYLLLKKNWWRNSWICITQKLSCDIYTNLCIKHWNNLKVGFFKHKTKCLSLNIFHLLKNC